MPCSAKNDMHASSLIGAGVLVLLNWHHLSLLALVRAFVSHSLPLCYYYSAGECSFNHVFLRVLGSLAVAFLSERRSENMVPPTFVDYGAPFPCANAVNGNSFTVVSLQSWRKRTASQAGIILSKDVRTKILSSPWQQERFVRTPSLKDVLMWGVLDNECATDEHFVDLRMFMKLRKIGFPEPAPPVYRVQWCIAGAVNKALRDAGGEAKPHEDLGSETPSSNRSSSSQDTTWVSSSDSED